MDRGVDIFSVPALTSRQGFREGLLAYLPGNMRFLDQNAQQNNLMLPNTTFHFIGYRVGEQ